ncbi:ATP-grasp domain-containing protein [Prosthecobacter sp.]|uniref:ATP-grasp domain-containing protein n=1 Tax=Prosthecobacter sp. TaxID=1965333 RepID=UPI0037851CD0
MKVLAQKNIWGEHGYDRFLKSLKNAGAQVAEVSLVPFTTEIVGLDGFQPDYVFGSTRFVTVCREKGMPVFPQVPSSSTDSGTPCFHAEDWLNSTVSILKLRELKARAAALSYPVFIKPVDTEKLFTGTVLESAADIEKLQLSTSFVANPDEERISLSAFKQIIEEIRFFVLHGKAITASQYKVKGLPAYKAVTPPHPAWIRAEELLSGGIPPAWHKGFVMDLGLHHGTWKIIELNDLGSAGIYLCDTDLLTRALALAAC